MGLIVIDTHHCIIILWLDIFSLIQLKANANLDIGILSGVMHIAKDHVGKVRKTIQFSPSQFEFNLQMLENQYRNSSTPLPQDADYLQMMSPPDFQVNSIYT